MYRACVVHRYSCLASETQRTVSSKQQVAAMTDVINPIEYSVCLDRTYAAANCSHLLHVSRLMSCSRPDASRSLSQRVGSHSCSSRPDANITIQSGHHTAQALSSQPQATRASTVEPYNPSHAHRIKHPPLDTKHAARGRNTKARCSLLHCVPCTLPLETTQSTGSFYPLVLIKNTRQLDRLTI